MCCVEEEATETSIINVLSCEWKYDDGIKIELD